MKSIIRPRGDLIRIFAPMMSLKPNRPTLLPPLTLIYDNNHIEAEDPLMMNLVLTSINPQVATVDESRKVTVHSGGVTYIIGQHDGQDIAIYVSALTPEGVRMDSEQ